MDFDLPKHALQLFCKRAGIPRVSGICYEEMRGIIKHFMEDFLGKIVVHTDHARRKTISVNDVYASMGVKVFLNKKDLKRCKEDFKKGQICVSFSKIPFYRNVKLVLKDIKPDLRVEEEAKILIQYYVEMFLLKLLATSRILMISQKQLTLYPRDLQYSQRVLREGLTIPHPKD